MQAGEGQRERENIKQATCSSWRQSQGSILQPWDHEMNQNQDSDTQVTEPPWHPSSYLYLNRYLFTCLFTVDFLQKHVAVSVFIKSIFSVELVRTNHLRSM